MNARTATAWCFGAAAALGLPAQHAPSSQQAYELVTTVVGAGRQTSAFATIIKLPSLGNPSEAVAVDDSGTTIAGHSWDRRGVLHAVKWTLQDGRWTVHDLPFPTAATSTIGRGVNNAGDVAGNDFPSSTSHAVLWPVSGGFLVLGCDSSGSAAVYGIGSAAQVAVGLFRGEAVTASVWRPGSCRESLLGLGEGSTAAYAVNGDGTVVGGAATQDGEGVPVRWTFVAGQWVAEQLDVRPGVVNGANSNGDLAGHVRIPCTRADGCARAVVWYSSGGARDLGTLGGDESWARDINASGEAVGGSARQTGANTGFFWSEATGMLQLPIKAQWAAANGISDVRPDGTRLVVGMDATGRAIAWVVGTL